MTPSRSPGKGNGHLLRLASDDNEHLIVRTLREKGHHLQRKGDNKYLTTCGYRADKNPSLLIEIKDDGRVRLTDNGRHGKDIDKALCAHLGIPESTLWPVRVRAKLRGKLKIVPVEEHGPDQLPGKYAVQGMKLVAVYQYLDADGGLEYEIVRCEKTGGSDAGRKSFLLRRYVGEGQYIYCADACITEDGREFPAVRYIPYRLHRFRDLPPGTPIYLVEGEKDVETAERLGLWATTTPFGAEGIGKTIEALCVLGAGRDFIIIPDNDEKGTKYADTAVYYLNRVCSSVRRCEPLNPNVPKGDLTDYVEAGGTREDVERHVAKVDPQPKPKADDESLAESADDLGFAEAFARRNRDRLCWNPQTKRWLFYNGLRWMDDQPGAAMRLAFTECLPWLQLAKVATENGDTKAAQGAARIATKLRSRGTIVNMIELAKAKLEASSDSFDRDPFLLNVQNGTIDLRTGDLRPHRPTDFITKLAPVEFHGLDAPCPLFEACLKTWSCDRPEWVRFVQQWAGYCLSGDNSEPRLPVFYGAGGNGKSLFLDITGEPMGDYAGTAPLGVLSESASERHQCEIMAFCGMRRIVSQEGKPNAPIREDFVRSLAEKKMTGRWVFSNPVTFTRTFKLTHVTNHMPRITAVDDAIRRRVIKVEWGHKVEHPDRGLFDKLKEELPGILAWMLRGFLDWQEHGFVIPGFMAEDTDAYLRDENPVAQFLSECCDLNNVEGKVRAKELHQSYTLWSETNGFHPLGNINFAKAIRLNVPTTVKKGTTDFGKGGKAEGWTGITLLPDAPRPKFS